LKHTRKKKRDANEADIVRTLRTVGCSVLLLEDDRRKGVPDLLVAYDNKMWLMEVKAPGKDFSKEQIEWLETWQTPVHVVHNEEEALRLVARL